MKCVVGIDLERRYASVIALLGKLQFPLEQTTLLHLTEPLQLSMPYSAYGMTTETGDIHETLRQAGEEVLDEAKRQAASLNLNPETDLCEGYPVVSLTDLAEQSGADLIAVTSTARSTFSAVFGGSVARGLALSSHKSILIAREEVPADGPLRAVFATDLSPYNAECLRLLTKLAPKGISHLMLLHVYEDGKHEGFLNLVRHPSARSAVEDGHRNVVDRLESDAKCLTERGIPTSANVVRGNVEETIHEVMKSTQADLLIVGSQGHGFVDRVLAGSTCLHQVISERYPVLLLRPQMNQGA